MSPYQDALDWIRRHPGTASASSLAKLILSLWNADCGFSLRECIGNLDDERTALALRMVTHFAAAGEDAGLVAAGHAVCRDYPSLWERGQAGDRAERAKVPFAAANGMRAEGTHARGGASDKQAAAQNG